MEFSIHDVRTALINYTMLRTRSKLGLLEIPFTDQSNLFILFFTYFFYLFFLFILLYYLFINLYSLVSNHTKYVFITFLCSHCIAGSRIKHGSQKKP